MAVGMWRGVDNVARKQKKRSRGVNNVARTIKKRWRGVDNVVRLTFTSGEMLYENGSNNANFAACNTSGTVTFNNDHIFFEDARNNIVSTSNTYDLSKYTKLCVEFDIDYNGSNRPYVGIRFAYTSGEDEMLNGSQYLPIKIGQVMTAEIDVSTKTRICDVIIQVVASSTDSGVSTSALSGSIYRIWLE